MKHHIGILGLIVGLLAVGVAIFQNDFRGDAAAEAEAELEKSSLTDLAVKASKRLIKEKIIDKDKPAPVALAEDEKPHDMVALTYMGLGFLAMVLGVISWAKKDHIRISGGAVALGLVAVAWQYVLIGVTIGVIIIIIANLGV